MSKQWIYRNGDTPFSVTAIEIPDGEVCYVSVTKSGTLVTHRPNGTLWAYSEDGYDLIPYEPYKDYVLNDVCLVTDYKGDLGNLAHWAGLDEEGRPTTYIEGGTSFTRRKDETVYWKYCKKIPPTKNK
jgi:hypothetical protein